MVFQEDELHRLGNAFDRAWERFLRLGLLTPRNLHSARDMLARRILDQARLGERDEWRLAREALGHFSNRAL